VHQTQRLVANAAVDLAQVVVAEDFAEIRVVQDLLEDGVVGVHSGDDGVEELWVEDEPEVVQCVLFGLRGERILRLRPPGLEVGQHLSLDPLQGVVNRPLVAPKRLCDVLVAASFQVLS
jgi:hypothetical protein